MASKRNMNGGSTTNATSDHAYSSPKERVPQRTSVPEAAASMKYFRVAMLLIYFWFGCFVIAPIQYAIAPMYLINKNSYYTSMAWTKRQMSILVLSMTELWTTTKVHVTADPSIRDQIKQLPDGRLQCNFASRMLLIANHQMYNDWVYLWWTAYTNNPSAHGWVYIVLKDSIQYIPVVGLGLRFAGFVFMSRKMKTDGPRLARRMSQLCRTGADGKLNPMWLLMFPEGTNLSRNGRAKSVKWAERNECADMKYQLIPRSTGTYFCLKALGETVEWVYDCTVAYDGVPDGQYGQDVFTLRSTYIDGKPPPIHMHWRRFAISSIPTDSPETFDAWLQDQWKEKDKLLEYHAKNGQFPSADGMQITTEVRLGRWREVWRFWGLLALFVGVLVRWVVGGGKIQ